jgi:hypothetical protein
MDAAPRSFDELPTDPSYGVPVPFAAGTEAGATIGGLDKRRVTQCALSRVCGVCGATLGRPLAFVGSRVELDRMAFHFPPTHVACAESLLYAYAGVVDPVLGLDVAPGEWVVATTASFEFVRAGRDDADRRPAFTPNGIHEQVGHIGA